MKYFEAYPCSIDENDEESLHERSAMDINSEKASSTTDSVGSLKGNEKILRLSRSSGLNLKILSMTRILMINIQKLNQILQLILQILIRAQMSAVVVHLENPLLRQTLTKLAFAANHLLRYQKI